MKNINGLYHQVAKIWIRKFEFVAKPIFLCLILIYQFDTNIHSNTKYKTYNKSKIISFAVGLTAKVDSYPCKVTLPVEISSPFGKH